jgi:hypothetical protein
MYFAALVVINKHCQYFPASLIAVGPGTSAPNNFVDLFLGEKHETVALLFGARRIVVLLLESCVCRRCGK